MTREIAAPGKNLAVVARCLAALTGCAEPPPEAGSADAARRTAVEAAVDTFHQALRTNDTALFAYVADDVVMMPPGEPVLRGKAAMREWYKGFLSVFTTSSLTFADREVLVGDDWAVELGSYEWGLTPAAGGAPVIDRGNYMQVCRSRPDGQWRFAREIWNSSVPAAPPAGP